MPSCINKLSAKNSTKLASGYALIAMVIDEAVFYYEDIVFPINLQPNVKLHKSAVIRGDQHQWLH